MGFGACRRAAVAAWTPAWMRSCLSLRRRRSGIGRAMALIWLIGLSVAGCSTTDVGTTGALSAASAAGPTVAFESIDGPPPGIFQKLVQNIEAEAGTRQIAVVS